MGERGTLWGKVSRNRAPSGENLYVRGIALPRKLVTNIIGARDNSLPNQATCVGSR